MSKELNKATVEETVEPTGKNAKPKVNAELEAKSDIEKTRKALENSDSVSFMVPLSEGEKPGAVHEVTINGCVYTVKKGVMTTVPQAVAEILANHYKIGMEAGAESRIDADEKKLEALS